MSLRARLLLGMAVVAVVLVLASWSINRATEHHLVEQVDEQLERTSRGVPGGYGMYPGPGRTDQDEDRERDEDEDDRRPPTALFVAAVDPQTGQLVVINRPDTLDDDAPTPDITAAQVTATEEGRPFTVGSDDERYRAIVRRIGPDGTSVIYAAPLRNVDEAIDRLLTIQALASGIILVTLGLVTFWVLRLGVRPVQQMTATARAIGEGDLSQRIPESAAGTEAGELGVALNQMLARIEHSFDEQSRSEARLRQFVADASHELRTPVTTIRGYAELYRMGGLPTDHEVSEAMRRTEQEATRMGQLVADLLDLARLDQGRPLSLAPVDLSALAADAVADARAVEPERPITLDAATPASLVGDEAYLRQILANLLANARIHTPPTAAVTVRVTDGPGEVVLEVADEGPGMPPEVAEHVFERFYRADPARARQNGGSGLGLAIVHGTVAAHGGTIALQTAPGHGTTVRVTIPKAAVPPPAAAQP